MKMSVQETVLIPNSVSVGSVPGNLLPISSLLVMPGGVRPIDLHAVDYADTLLNRWADEQCVALSISDDEQGLLPARYVTLCKIRGGINGQGELRLVLEGTARAIVTRLGAKAADGLLRATVSPLKECFVPAETPVPAGLEQLVHSAHQQLGMPWSGLQCDNQPAAHWLSDRLLELLPIEQIPLDKIFAENDPLERLRWVVSALTDSVMANSALANDAGSLDPEEFSSKSSLVEVHRR